jgi:hypothetical protein
MTGPITRPGIDCTSSVTGRCQARKDPSPASAHSRRLTMESLYCLFASSATGSTVQCQHEQDIVDPPSIIKLLQEHPYGGQGGGRTEYQRKFGGLKIPGTHGRLAA